MQATSNASNAQGKLTIDPRQIEVQAQQLGAIICNALGMLWAAGEHTAAKSPVTFTPDTSPFGVMAKQNGITIYTLTSSNLVLGMQFPAFMFFLLPTSHAEVILGIVSKLRLAFLHELTA